MPRTKRIPWHQPHEPIPKEIEARLTKPKTENPLYRVYVEKREDGKVIPVGPKMIWDAADQLQLSIAKQIALGNEKLWGNPHIVQCFELNS